MVAPARDPRRAPRHKQPARPNLRVARPDLRVAGKPSKRRRRTGPRLAAGLMALFLALFSNAVAHSVLVSGQERLDGLNQRVEQERARNRQLHLESASLEAPERIVAAATEMGLKPAEQTTWLAPGRDPGTVASTTEHRDAPTGEDSTEELAGAKDDGTDPADR